MNATCLAFQAAMLLGHEERPDTTVETPDSAGPNQSGHASLLKKGVQQLANGLNEGNADTVPDANTIWTFRETLTKAVIDGRLAIEILFQRFDAALAKAGFLAMGGQIVDASIVAAPKQRNTDAEKREIREGRIPADWA